MATRPAYADQVRDAWMTASQVPVAVVHAADYYWQQWVERASTFASTVGTRITLAKSPVVADVVVSDLMDLSLAMIRTMVSLPAETATYFNRQLEQMVREVTSRLHPEASADLRAYLLGELDKISLEIERLQQIAAAEAPRRGRLTAGRAPRYPAGAPENQLNLVESALARSSSAIAKRRGPPESTGARATRLAERFGEILQEISQVRLATASGASEKLHLAQGQLRQLQSGVEDALGRRGGRTLKRRLRRLQHAIEDLDEIIRKELRSLRRPLA
jgi:hypothetical protein